MDSSDSASDCASDSEMDIRPEFIKEEPKEDSAQLLPVKSEYRYLRSYEDFMKWRAERGDQSISESLLLVYFNELSKKLKPSSLWSVYSMLKTTLSAKQDINLKEFTNLSSFLKRQADGFKPKKSNVFTSEQIQTFISQAPDQFYLAVKVVLILAVCGACKSLELVNLKMSDVKKQGEIILVTLRGSRKEADRSFVIKQDYVHIIEKYLALRPSDIQTDRFFLSYQKGKCIKQVIGKNKMAVIPKEIATYLDLPNPDSYSGHCLRRTSLLADFGANRTNKNIRARKSRIFAEVYLNDSLEEKHKILPREREKTEMLNEDEPSQPSTSMDEEEKYAEVSLSPTLSPNIQHFETVSNINIPGKNIRLTISNCSNFNIHFTK